MANSTKKHANIRRKKPKKGEIETKELESLKLKLEKNEYSLDDFKSFPISNKTIKGLVESNFLQPTEIQKESIILALKGNDILGAAKTGSGKTLAFLIPVLEKLYHLNWTQYDGLGALIISPTRELAYQTFEVLKKWANIMTSQLDVNFEKHKISQTNIIVCTPGRLLQHLEQTTLFVCDNLQVLILDEADRILDLGFQTTINSILESLPVHRQTLLFSATQTKSVKDLARLSLENPIFISTNANNQETTPQQLIQSYIACELKDKLSLLYSFIKNHINQKIIVFLTSCKQVKFIYSALCRMKPGMSILALYGTMNQLKRVATYDEFSRKQNAVLIATDIAARGLDFPEVHWVVQMDCPEDVNTYIHRVSKGWKGSIIFDAPEEKIFLNYLHDKNISIKKIDINPQKVYPTTTKLESACAKDTTLKIRAQKCFISYLRAVFLMKDKQLFDVHKIDTDSYAYSLGLAIPPRIRFLKKAEKLKSNDKGEGKSFKPPGRGQKYGEKNSSDIGNAKIVLVAEPSEFSQLFEDKKSGESDTENDLFVIKKRKLVQDLSTLNGLEAQSGKVQQGNILVRGPGGKGKPGPVKSKYTEAKKLIKLAQQKKLVLNQRIVFDENDDVEKVEGTPVDRLGVETGGGGEGGGLDIEMAKQWLREQDVLDKRAFREKVKAKHKEKRIKEREAKKLKSRRSQGDPEEQDEVDVDGDVEYDEILQEDPKLASIIDSLPDPDKVYGENGCRENVKLPVKATNKRKKLKASIEENEFNAKVPFDVNLKANENIAIKLLENF